MSGEITRSSLALSAGNNSMTSRCSSQNTLASNLQFALDDGIGVHGLIAREDPHHREPSAPRAARPPTAPPGPDTGIGYDQVTRLQIDHTSAHCENLYRSVRKLCRSEPQTPAARTRTRALLEAKIAYRMQANGAHRGRWPDHLAICANTEYES
jgi:hypothetical protein